MSLRRLQQRVPGVRRLGPARLHAHQLRFHKVGRDGSGKCDAFFTGGSADLVHGVLYHIEHAEKDSLEAVTYVATRIAGDLRPFEWYLNHVLVGAREAALPTPYIADIQRVDAIPDPNRKRHAREISIHG